MGKFGVKFCDTFGIPTVPRKAIRQRVNELHVRALKLPQDDDAKKVVVDLEAARKTVYDKVHNNEARQKSVDTATTQCDDLEPRLIALEKTLALRREEELKNNPGLAPMTGRVAKPTKEDKDRRDALLKREENLHEALDTAKPSLSGIIPDKDTASFSMLQLQAAAWLREVGTETVTTEREKTLDKGYKDVLDQIQLTVAAYDKLRKEVESIQATLLMGVAPVLETVRKEISDDDALKQTPLSRYFAQLSDALTADILFPDRLRAFKADLVKEADEANKDPSAYAVKYKTAGTDAAAAKKRLADYDRRVATAMAALDASCVPLDEVTRLKGKSADARESVAAAVQPPPDVAAIATTVVEAVGKAIQDSAGAVDTSRKVFDDLADSIETLMAGLDAVLTTPLMTQEAAQLQGLLDGFNVRKPPTVVDREGLADLSAAVSLGTKLKERLQALTTKKVALADFATKFEAVQGWLADKGKAGKDSPLAEYYPDKQQQRAEEFAAIRNDLGKSAALGLLDRLEPLHTALNKEADDAAAEDTKLTGTVSGGVEKMEKLYKKVYLKNPIKTISATEHGIALQAYKRAVKDRPLDMKKVEDAAAAVQAAFARTATEADLLKHYADTAGQRDSTEAWCKSKVERLEQEKAELVDRLNALSGRFDFAKAAVDDAHGDINAVKAAQALFNAVSKQVNQHVKSGTKLVSAAADQRVLAGGDAGKVKAAEDTLATQLGDAKVAVERTMERLDERLDLMLVRPEGQRGAKLKALPDLFKRWEGTRKLARDNLDAFAATLRRYTPKDPAAGGRRDALVTAVEAYRDFVTGETKAIAGAVSRLISVDAVPDADRRLAREDALGDIHERQAAIAGHRLSATLALCPFDEARTVPARLSAVLSQLEFTILTAVE